MLDSIPINNPNVSFLQNELSKKFNSDKWNELQRETNFFKLDWKSNVSNEENTFYKTIICK